MPQSPKQLDEEARMTELVRRLRALFLGLAWTVCVAVLAAEPTSDISASDDAPMQTAASARERLAGRFIIAWIGDRDDDDALEVQFIPDALPADWLAVGCDIASLAIANRDEAILGLIGPELAALVLEGAFAGVTGDATLVVDSVECAAGGGQAGAARITAIESVRVRSSWTPAQRALERRDE
jgi:hypothetical protein